MESDQAVPALPSSVNHISVVITGDREIHKLNKSYRGKDKPTDVLSFSQLEGEDSFGISSSIGDLVISADTTLSQAKEFNCTPQEELLRLIVHGTLHLFGFDHEKVAPSRARRMFMMQDSMIEKFRELL